MNTHSNLIRCHILLEDATSTGREQKSVCVRERGRDMCYESNKVVNVCLKRGYRAIYICINKSMRMLYRKEAGE